MKKRITWRWLLAFILVLSMGLAACGSSANTTNTAADTEAKSAIDVDELMKDPDNGVVVTYVNADSPAEKVGLQKGDVILMVGDQEVNDVDDLREVLETYQEGDKVQVAVRRGDELLMKTVELDEGPGRAYLGAATCCGGTMLAVREGGLFGGGAQALILDVTPDTPAERAGLEIGDYIVSVDGSEIETDQDLGDVIQSYQPGDSITLEISRDSEEQEVKVKLGDNPEAAGTAYLGVQYQMVPAIGFIGRGDFPELEFKVMPGENGRLRGVLPFIFGMPFGMHEDSFSTFDGDIQGIFISSVVEGSPAEDAGLQSHDVITKLNGEDIEDLDEFSQAIRALAPGDDVSLTIARSGEDEEMELTVILGEHPDEEGVGYLGVTLGGMIVTEVVTDDGGEGEIHRPFHFYMHEFPHFSFPGGDDV